MHDSIDLVSTKYGIKRRGVADIALDQSTPSYKSTVPERQIIKHDALVPLCSESLGTMAADVTSASGDQDASHVNVGTRRKNIDPLRRISERVARRGPPQRGSSATPHLNRSRCGIVPRPSARHFNRA